MVENNHEKENAIDKAETDGGSRRTGGRYYNPWENTETIIFYRNLTLLIFTALLMLAYINLSGKYPWGSDTYGHLFKGNILYDSLKKRELFLNYNEYWYNGIQPFRYWAPLPYYILAVINLFANNIIITFNIYTVFIFITGGLGWLCHGYYLKRQNLGVLIAILWFFIPDNLRVLFSEGNLPFSLVNALIPFAFYYFHKSMDEKKVKDYLVLAAFMAVITLAHAMLSAMLGLSMFILYVSASFVHRFMLKNLLPLLYAFLGIMVTSFWLYPALKGGIMTIDQSAVAEVMKSLTYPLTYSLNPMLRFSNIEVYYYGLGFAIAALFGLLFSTKNERAAFITSLVILAGTTKFALPLLQQLPMNQLFWMRRFTSISMALILTGLIRWKTLRKSILSVLLCLLLVDSGLSFYLLGHNGLNPDSLSKTIEIASRISVQRIGVLDNSTFGSYPSFYISYNSVHGIPNQVYGWAWQGAATSENIVMINTALENGYYELMFDRSLELGADTLIVRKSVIKDINLLEKYAYISHYNKYYEDNNVILYRYPVQEGFGTMPGYKGIAIGAYSPNIAYIFPSIQTSDDKYIDDYSYEELKVRKVIFLSGFDYRNKKAAEELIKKLSANGTRIVIDVEGMEESFLGVTPQPIILNDKYNNLVYNGRKLSMKSFPQGFKSWRTFFLNGVDNRLSYSIENYRFINYIGYKYNNNLIFVGLNLPYYAFLTKDTGAVKILEDSLNIKAYELPDRKVYPVNVSRRGDILSIKSSVSGVIVPVAALDAFKRISGFYNIEDNLIHINTPELRLKIIYPYLMPGILISAVAIALIIYISWLLFFHIKPVVGKD